MKLIEAEGVKYWTSDEELKPGDLYCACDPASTNPDEWIVCTYRFWPSEGGRNVIEVIINFLYFF